jgi:hypothetical protein
MSQNSYLFPTPHIYVSKLMQKLKNQQKVFDQEAPGVSLLSKTKNTKIYDAAKTAVLKRR